MLWWCGEIGHVNIWCDVWHCCVLQATLLCWKSEFIMEGCVKESCNWSLQFITGIGLWMVAPLCTVSVAVSLVLTNFSNGSPEQLCFHVCNPVWSSSNSHVTRGSCTSSRQRRRRRSGHDGGDRHHHSCVLIDAAAQPSNSILYSAMLYAINN